MDRVVKKSPGFFNNSVPCELTASRAIVMKATFEKCARISNWKGLDDYEK